MQLLLDLTCTNCASDAKWLLRLSPGHLLSTYYLWESRDIHLLIKYLITLLWAQTRATVCKHRNTCPLSLNQETHPLPCAYAAFFWHFACRMCNFLDPVQRCDLQSQGRGGGGRGSMPEEGPSLLPIRPQHSKADSIICETVTVMALPCFPPIIFLGIWLSECLSSIICNLIKSYLQPTVLHDINCLLKGSQIPKVLGKSSDWDWF